MSSVSNALQELNITDYVLSGEPSNETEFNSLFQKVTSVSEDGTPTYSSDIADFGVTWAQVETKLNELNDAEPLKLLREERNAKLAETDWWVLPDRTATDEQTAYRQALRDITDTYSSLDTVVWPTKP